jgi:hypothetical protein
MKLEKIVKFNWRDVYRFPAALFLSLLIRRNYSLRRKKLLPDQWYWADKQICNWGYTMKDESL